MPIRTRNRNLTIMLQSLRTVWYGTRVTKMTIQRIGIIIQTVRILLINSLGLLSMTWRRMTKSGLMKSSFRVIRKTMMRRTVLKLTSAR